MVVLHGRRKGSGLVVRMWVTAGECWWQLSWDGGFGQKVVMTIVVHENRELFHDAKRVLVETAHHCI